MFVSIIKYIFIYFCAIHIYMIALNAKQSLYKSIVSSLLAIVLGVIIGLLKPHITPVHTLLSVVVFVVFLSFKSRKELATSIVITFISFGISSSLHILSSVICSILLYYIFRDRVFYLNESISIIVGVVQTLLTFLVFRSERMRNGFSKIVSNNSQIGFYLSILLCVITFIINLLSGVNIVYLVPVFCVLLFSILLIFWQRDQIAKTYISRALRKQIDILEATIAEKDTFIENLRQDNENLASIIHRDNKLLPAMKLAVERYVSSNSNQDELRVSHDLSDTIDNMLSERHKAIRIMESHASYDDSITGYSSIDAMLIFMTKRASEDNIDVSFVINLACLKEITSFIYDFELNTVIADLLENAIIATRAQDNKQIKIEVNKLNETCIISIYDTGVMFSAGVLQSMGYKKVTTHADDGGSGIGLMSTFEITKKYNASFIIEEYPQGYEFRKKISVAFDEKSSFKLFTFRENELIHNVTRSDIQILPLQ